MTAHTEKTFCSSSLLVTGYSTCLKMGQRKRRSACWHDKAGKQREREKHFRDEHNNDVIKALCYISLMIEFLSPESFFLFYYSFPVGPQTNLHGSAPIRSTSLPHHSQYHPSLRSWFSFCIRSKLLLTIKPEIKWFNLGLFILHVLYIGPSTLSIYCPHFKNSNIQIHDSEVQKLFTVTI